MGLLRPTEPQDDASVDKKPKGGRRGGDGGGISIAERRAAKCGFNADRINTARFRTSAPFPSPSPTARSPCLTIPPGISPTALLDSPLMLPNSQALPSPTTGSFPLLHPNDDTSVLKSATQGDGRRGTDFGSSFSFKRDRDPKCLPDYACFENQGPTVDYQALALEQLPVDFEFPMEFPEEANENNCLVDPSTHAKNLNSVIMNADCVEDLQLSHSSAASDQNSLPKEPFHGEDVGTHHFSEGEHKGSYPSGGVARNSEDGYNWRKYGQKQVKGSEYPRSYYKCTNPNCQVKKKVERSFDGQITEIIYNGSPHNHAKPQPNRRSGASLGPSSSLDEMSEMGEGSRASLKVEGGSVWTNIQSGKEVKVGYDGRENGLERTSSTSVVTELSSHDDDDDRATQGSISLGDDADDEESESKRRKKESCLIETNLASRTAREPRVVVQIESEIDILDDGYRWRKYGQKVVKGNPNPRSYYKCTSAGCSVRKHVERASHNLKFVITTYEGKHNHEVPAARNSNHMNSSGGNGHASTANGQPALTIPRNTNIPKPETQVEDVAPHFDRKPEFHGEYLRPSFLGNFNNDLKFGVSSIYQMKYPAMHSSLSYNLYGLHGNHNVGVAHHHQAGSVVPDLPISLPLTLAPSANLPRAGYDYNNGKPVCAVEAYFSGQQVPENDTRLVKPKQEQKDEEVYDACLPVIDEINGSLSSLLYNERMMGGYPC